MACGSMRSYMGLFLLSNALACYKHRSKDGRDEHIPPLLNLINMLTHSCEECTAVARYLSVCLWMLFGRRH